jgi:hypothetical protein
LKYSQLIQILRINLEIAAATRFAAAIAARINQRSPTPTGAKTGAGGVKAAFAALKTGPSGYSALYAALTLSRTTCENRCRRGAALGASRLRSKETCFGAEMRRTARVTAW